jgi:hypothetical protein
MVFTNGEFEGIYYSEEIDFFVKKGGVVLDIKLGYVFENQEMSNYFENFVDNMILLRKNTKKKI